MPHMVVDTFIENLRDAGCQLSPSKIKNFLDDLGLRHEWVFDGEALRKVPHGWTPEGGEYPLDADGVWSLWSWTPSPEFERDNP